MKNVIKLRRYEAGCGTLRLGALGERLCICDWVAEQDSEQMICSCEKHEMRNEKLLKHCAKVDGRLKRALEAEFEEGTAGVLDKAVRQLDEYFAGERREFDLPLLLVGTDFQKTVWNELRKIPFGETISYGELAQRIGRPESVRAVANANGANAISIFIPCHRVIGSNHTLTGYAGGIEAKRQLLELENLAL